MNLDNIDVQTIQAGWLQEKQVALDVLRLDKVHNVVSGNKYFKLKYYLSEALENNKTTVATFGGAWSNHIVATAFACKVAGLQSVGIIRGEKPSTLSDTLQQAMEYGMNLKFVSREQYRNKQELINQYNDDNYLWIPEGGYGETGARGASEILQLVDASVYTHIIAAVGTGTMLAGLIKAALPGQSLIGISSMKGNLQLQQDVNSLIGAEKVNFTILHDYHFGGYGKHPATLIEFINNIYKQHALPLDIVYTSKTFYAIKDLVEKNFFPSGSKVLMIHSGGLQGNRSLTKVLAF